MTSTTISEAVAAPAWAIRRELPIDIDQVHELHRSAFPGPAEAELVDAIRSSPFHVPELSLVAVTADGSILGHILVSQVSLVADDREPIEILALAPLAVLPPHQGIGIGTGLTTAAMAAADLRPEPMTVVLGGPDFYARFGFVPAADHEVIGPFDGVGDAFQLRPRTGADAIPAGLVVYPPAFGAVPA
jgi:putative acetyltransferase